MQRELTCSSSPADGAVSTTEYLHLARYLHSHAARLTRQSGPSSVIARFFLRARRAISALVVVAPPPTATPARPDDQSNQLIPAVTMTTAMPVYVCVVLARATAQQLWALTELVWESSAGKVLFTLGGWLLPHLGTETEDDAYRSIRQCAQAPVLGGPTAAVCLPVYAAVKGTLKTLEALHAAALLMWESSAGKVLFTLGGWLLPKSRHASLTEATQYSVMHETMMRRIDDLEAQIGASGWDASRKSLSWHASPDCLQTGIDEWYHTIRWLASKPLIGGPIAVLLLPVWVVCFASVWLWKTSVGRALLTLGGWLLPKLVYPESDGRSKASFTSVYHVVRSVGTTPVLGGPLALPLLCALLAVCTLWLVLKYIADMTVAIVQGIEFVAKLTWSYRSGKVLMTLGGWLVPQLGTTAEHRHEDGHPPQQHQHNYSSVPMGALVCDRLLFNGEDAVYTSLRKCARQPIVGGPIAVVCMPVYLSVKGAVKVLEMLHWVVVLIWGSSLGKVLFTLGGWLVPRPTRAVRCGYPIFSDHIHWIAGFPIVGCFGLVTFVAYCLSEVLALALFKRPSIRGAWWRGREAMSQMWRVVRHTGYSLGVTMRRQLAISRNYIATHRVEWVPHTQMGVAFSLPRWAVAEGVAPPYGLECYDHELFEANLDVADGSYPRALAAEAVDRAIAMAILKIFDVEGCSWLAPATQVMLASTAYESTRGALTFASGTLSIGKLSVALAASAVGETETKRHRDIQRDTQRDTQTDTEQNASAAAVATAQQQNRCVSKDQSCTELDQLTLGLQRLQTIRKQIVLIPRAFTAIETERSVDQILCAALGSEGVDALRCGDCRRKVEHWALLLTGLSAPDLVRAKRLRDTGQLLTGGPSGSNHRQDLVDLLATVDRMCLELEQEAAAAGIGADSLVVRKREEVWERLVAARVAQPAVRSEMRRSLEQVDGRTAQVSSVHVLPVTVFAEPLTQPEPEPESQADDTEVQLVRVLPHTTYAFGYTVPTVPAWHATTDDGELPSPTPLHQAEY
eukprot:COSAG03_NODE_1392_length_4178_cov_3.543516_2_plen_1023_part_00